MIPSIRTRSTASFRAASRSAQRQTITPLIPSSTSRLLARSTAQPTRPLSAFSKGISPFLEKASTTYPLHVAKRKLASPAASPAPHPMLSNPAIPLPAIPIMASPFPPTPPLPKASGVVNLVLPPTEDRPHKYFTLTNGLEVIVVSDPKADKAAASMDVGVGHLSDPDNLPGCAHFCEHLLFMGTKTYPSENDYQSYLNTHNGGSNAWTAMTSTTYFFDVSADALEGALDRFAGFFYEPLFNEDCTEREIKAVDSEHKKNLQSDMWRFFQLEKHVLRSDHAYHKFGTGNYDSLWSEPKADGRDPRQQLIEWWEKNYCARRMKLAVVGREDVATLEQWVRDRFEKVPVRTEGLPEVGVEGVRVVFDESPMGPEQMGRITFTKPVKDNRGIEITFPFPDLDHLFQCKPTHYVTHFLGHEGKGSILSYLKQKGWSNYLRAGMSHGAAGFDFFKITIDLTPDGLKHWQDAALVIFKYISLLRSQPPSSTIFDEIKTMADISFRFAEKHRPDNYCTELTGGMQEPVPRDRIVSSKYVMEEWRPEEVEAVLQLLDPRRASVGVTSRELPPDVEGLFELKEPIYGTEYKQIKVPEEFMKEALGGAPIPELKLPAPNPFIPKRLDVEKFDVKEKAIRPELLRDTSLSRLWYKRDDTWWLPKTNVDIKLTSPLLLTTPRNAVLTTLLCEMFTDSVTEETYDADLAELSFRLYTAGEWIGVMARGFSDKLAVLAETMLRRLMQFEVDESRFKEVVDQLKLHWGNFKLNEPFRQIGFWDGYATQQVAWTQEERLAELEFITPEDVKMFGREVFKRLYIETLIHGNTSPEGAKEIQDMVERVLQPHPLTQSEKLGSRSLILPPSSEHVWSFDLPNQSEINGAVTYTLNIGDITDYSLRARLQVFAQIVNEPAFDRLRTKEQLGYIVSTAIVARTGSLSFRVLVQSEREPVYVESRIEAFLDGMREYIEALNEEDYTKHVQSLVQKKEEKAKNLGEETRRFWGRIADRYYEFSKRQTEIAYLRMTTKSDVLDLLNNFIHTSSPTRSKLSVHLRSQYKGFKFDPSSATPLIEAFTKHSIPVDESALTALIGSSPDLEKVKEFATAAVEKTEELEAEGKREVLTLIAGLKGKEAGERTNEELEARVREGNVWIEDINLFKAGLTPSKAAMPLEPIKAVAKL